MNVQDVTMKLLAANILYSWIQGKNDPENDSEITRAPSSVWKFGAKGKHCLIFNQPAKLCWKSWGLDIFPAEIWKQEPLPPPCGGRTITSMGIEGREWTQRV